MRLFLSMKVLIQCIHSVVSHVQFLLFQAQWEFSIDVKKMFKKSKIEKKKREREHLLISAVVTFHFT